MSTENCVFKSLGNHLNPLKTRCTLNTVWTQYSWCVACVPWNYQLFLWILISLRLKNRCKKVSTIKRSFCKLIAMRPLLSFRSFRIPLWIGHCQICMEGHLKLRLQMTKLLYQHSWQFTLVEMIWNPHKQRTLIKHLSQLFYY